MLGVECGALEKRALRECSKMRTVGRALQLVNRSQVVYTSFQTLHGHGTMSVLDEECRCEFSGTF
jgi:hypothetical protein